MSDEARQDHEHGYRDGWAPASAGNPSAGAAPPSPWSPPMPQQWPPLSPESSNPPSPEAPIEANRDHTGQRPTQPWSAAPAEGSRWAATPVEPTSGPSYGAAAPATPGYPVERPATSAFPVERPATSAFPVERPATSAFPVERPATPAFPVERPAAWNAEPTPAQGQAAAWNTEPTPAEAPPGAWNTEPTPAEAPPGGWNNQPFPVQDHPASWPGPAAAPPDRNGAWNPEAPVPEQRPSVWGPQVGTSLEVLPDTPRISPSPPRRRSGLWVGLAIGLVLALLTGGVGFYVGTRTGNGSASAGPAKPGTSAEPTLRPYEASQMALNKAKLDGELAPLAQPWLPWMGGCAADTDTGGPKLPADESKHVFCRYDGVSVHFALFKSPTERDAARGYRQQLNFTTDGLAPGLEQPSHKTGGVSGAQGDYVEYALKGSDGRALCGVWWNREGGSAALLLETLCEEGLGGSWNPLRDLWQRYS